MQIDPDTIHKEVVTALGFSAPSSTTVTRRVKHFREGTEDINDGPRSASPISKFTGENIQLVRQVISNDPYSTNDEIIAETSISLSFSHGTIERIIHNWLTLKKATSRWVPHQLTDEQKQRVKLCFEILAKFQNDS